MEKVKLSKTGEMISKMCLGTMYFGSRISEKDSFELMDYYYSQGGMTFDTSNNYCFWLGDFKGGESETTIGRWIKSRKNRDDIFIATKCGVLPINRSNTEFEGLSKKAIFSAVDKSLSRLQTDYIDLYYMHVDWRKESLEETLDAFNELIKIGKIKNIASSNMTTWRMLKAKEISRKNDYGEFSAIQNWYSYLQPRDNADMWIQKFVNKELLDYCETEDDLTIFSYSSTLGGSYNWDSIYDKKHPALSDRFYSEDNERRFKLLKDLAKEKNISPIELMFAWILKHKVSIVPILGVSKINHLKSNLSALNINLSDEEFELMNNAAFNKKEAIDKIEYSLL